MAFATEGSSQIELATRKGSRLFRVFFAVALMAFAANCFLKYIWWTACYSAWYGIPKLAEQWRAAGTRASFNLWAVAVLDLTSLTILFTALRSPSSGTAGLQRTAPRLILALVITFIGTALLALALSWIKQGIH